VAIDWAVVGIGWIGWEIGMLVGNPLTHLNSSRAEVRQRDRVVFEGYLEGLRDSGWRGDRRLARLGQTAIWGITPRAPYVSFLADDSRHAWGEQVLGCSVAEFADYHREQVRHPWLDWAQEARELLSVLR
jgi:hypothetical protein